MTVLVTGATGFVGRHLVSRMVADRYEIRSLVRPGTDSRRIPAGTKVVVGDIGTDDDFDDAVHGCDTVFHLAAVHGAHVRAADCTRVNVRGTIALAEAAARAGVSRFVFASTRGVHGLVRGGSINENTPTAADTPYRLSKVQAERGLERISGSHGLSVVILRLPSMIGPYAMGWLGLFRAVARGNFRIIGSGNNQQHPCPVADAVQAILLGGTAPNAGGETFLFSGAEVVTTGEFIRMIASALGVSVSRLRIPLFPYHAMHAGRITIARLRRLRTVPERNEFFAASYSIDDSKARRVLGHAPVTPLDTAVRATAAWYREEGLLVASGGLARNP